MNLRLDPYEKKLTYAPGQPEDPEDLLDALKTQGSFTGDQKPWRLEETMKSYQVHVHLRYEYLLGIAC